MEDMTKHFGVSFGSQCTKIEATVSASAVHEVDESSGDTACFSM